MEYAEAVMRLAQLKQMLGSGIKGDEYKQVLAEYMQLRQMVIAAKAQGAGSSSGGGGDSGDMGSMNEGTPWWQRRGGPSLLGD